MLMLWPYNNRIIMNCEKKRTFLYAQINWSMWYDHGFSIYGYFKVQQKYANFHRWFINPESLLNSFIITINESSITQWNSRLRLMELAIFFRFSILLWFQISSLLLSHLKRIRRCRYIFFKWSINYIVAY